MKQLKVMLGDRRRRQSGSVLSGLLIIVAFLSILIGALMTELTTSFLISRSHTARVAREATASSAVELAINGFQNRVVPTSCGTDRLDLVPLQLNGSSATGTSSCTAIVPDWARLATGAFAVDGTHALVRGRNTYLVGDKAGNLRSYLFGQTSEAWSIPTGGALTAPPFAKADPTDILDVAILVPSANPGSGCQLHCVELFEEVSGGRPQSICSMAASSVVSARPAAELTGAGPGNFPRYTFFGDAGGNLYVFDATTSGECDPRKTQGGLGGTVVGDLLVFPGQVTTSGGFTTTSDEIFVVVSGAGWTQLVHWRYSEAIDSRGNVVTSMGPSGEPPRPILVGNTSGYAVSSTVPAVGSTLSLAFAGAGGNLALATISVRSGPRYTMSGGSPASAVPGAIGRSSPFWCHCPGGRDLIGIGSTNGTLYILDTGFNLFAAYDGSVDGEPGINTTPAADANGNWYFGADDGYVYNVEIPASGRQMFKAARVLAGGAIYSSPVVGSDLDGCAQDLRLAGRTPCLYLASSTSGVWFARIGSTRVLDVRVQCLSAGSDPTCINPKLWAQVQVGYGVKVSGWSYYAP